MCLLSMFFVIPLCSMQPNLALAVDLAPAGFHVISSYRVFPAGTKIIGANSLEDMVSKLKKPRRVMMLVKAGSAVDAFIDQLVISNDSLCL